MSLKGAMKKGEACEKKMQRKSMVMGMSYFERVQYKVMPVRLWKAPRKMLFCQIMRTFKKVLCTHQQLVKMLQTQGLILLSNT